MAPPAKPPLWREGPLWPIWKCICLFWPEGPLLLIWIWMPFARGAALAGDISGQCGHGHMDVHFSQWGFSGRFEHGCPFWLEGPLQPIWTWMSILARGASPADLDMDVYFGQRAVLAVDMDVHFGRVLSSRFGHGRPFLLQGPLRPICTWMSVLARGASPLRPIWTWMSISARGASPADLDMDVHVGQREFSSRCAER